MFRDCSHSLDDSLILPLVADSSSDRTVGYQWFQKIRHNSIIPWIDIKFLRLEIALVLNLIGIVFVVASTAEQAVHRIPSVSQEFGEDD